MNGEAVERDDAAGAGTLGVYADARGLEADTWRGWQVYAFEALVALARRDAQLRLCVQIRGDRVPKRLEPLADLANVNVTPVASKRWGHLAVPLGVRRSRSAIYWRLFNEFRPIFVPPGVPAVATVHDLQRVVLEDDGRFRARPQVPRSWSVARRQIHHIITVSESTRRGVVELLGWPAGRVTVVPNGFNEPSASPVAPPGLNGDERFLLAVNVGHYYKNWQQVLEGFAAAADEPEMRGVLLVIAGDIRAQGAQIDSFLAAHATFRARVRLLGQVGSAELSWLYARCIGLLALSRYEGFDRPVIEAAAFGAPIIASDIEVHREVTTAGAVFVALDDVAATCEAICRVAQHAEKPVTRPFVGVPPQYRWSTVASLLSRCLRSVAASRWHRQPSEMRVPAVPANEAVDAE